VGVSQGAIVGIALGQRRDDDLRQSELTRVSPFGLVVPNHNRAVILVRLGSHDLWDHDGKEVVTQRNRLLIGVGAVCDPVVGKVRVQRGVHFIVLVRRNEVVPGDRVVSQVRL